MPQPLIIDRPVFIVGCGRSGTTLLFDWLAQHPGLAATRGYPDGEDHEGWITHGQCVMAGIGSPGSDRFGSGINGFNACLHMDKSAATPDVRAAMHRYYLQEVLKGRSDKRVLNKCPHNANKLRYLLGLFPDARIIHIIRDCEPVVASWMAIMKAVPSLVVYLPENEPHPCLWLMQAPASESQRRVLASHPRFYPGGGETLWVEYWVKTNVGVEVQMDGHLDQLLSLRYEDLIAAPQFVLDEIVRFCGLPPHRFATGGVDRQTAHKHGRQFSQALRDAIAQEANPVRSRFGYVPAADGVPPCTPPARLFRPTAEVLAAHGPPQWHPSSHYILGILECAEAHSVGRAWRLDCHAELPLGDELALLRSRFLDLELSLDEALTFFQRVVEAVGTFPPDWECYILHEATRKFPDRTDLETRLRVVKGQLQALARPNPLLQ